MRTQRISIIGIIGVLLGASASGCGDDTANPFVFDAGAPKDATAVDGAKDASPVDAATDVARNADSGDGALVPDVSVDGPTDGALVSDVSVDGTGVLDTGTDASSD